MKRMLFIKRMPTLYQLLFLQSSIIGLVVAIPTVFTFSYIFSDIYHNGNQFFKDLLSGIFRRENWILFILYLSSVAVPLLYIAYFLFCFILFYRSSLVGRIFVISLLLLSFLLLMAPLHLYFSANVSSIVCLIVWWLIFAVPLPIIALVKNLNQSSKPAYL